MSAPARDASDGNRCPVLRAILAVGLPVRRALGRLGFGRLRGRRGALHRLLGG